MIQLKELTVVLWKEKGVRHPITTRGQRRGATCRAVMEYLKPPDSLPPKYVTTGADFEIQVVGGN